MKERLTLKERQNVSLQILIEVDEFCKKNSIQYFLGCGTLLGSIRHKGFIPWDDDIDILMFRDDFNKFLNTYKSDKYLLSNPLDGRYCIGKVYDPKTIEYEKDTSYKKRKPIGVDIDIFPLDGIINDEQIIKKMYKKQCFLEMLLRLSNQPLFLRKNPLKCINRIVPRIIGSTNIVKMIIKNQTIYPIDKSDYVVRMKRSNNGFTGALKKEVYEVTYGEFEGHMFPIPKGYDEWLKAFFGDYMKLPPEEKRVPHISECYWVENEN